MCSSLAVCSAAAFNANKGIFYCAGGVLDAEQLLSLYLQNG